MFDLHVAAAAPSVKEANDIVFNYFELGATLLSSVAWPAILIAVILCFRRQIGDLLGRVNEVSGPGGLAAKFQQLDFASATASASPSAAGSAEEGFAFMASAAPRRAILEAYNHLFAKIKLKAFREKPDLYQYPLESIVARLNTPSTTDASPVMLHSALKAVYDEVLDTSDASVSADEALRFWNGVRVFLRLLEESSLA